MDFETLEELLSDFLPSGFKIESNKKGEIIVYTSLRQDKDGDLVDIKNELDDDESLQDESDFDPLEDDDCGLDE